jgi:hypothetical protein
MPRYVIGKIQCPPCALETLFVVWGEPPIDPNLSQCSVCGYSWGYGTNTTIDPGPPPSPRSHVVPRYPAAAYARAQAAYRQERMDMLRVAGRSDAEERVQRQLGEALALEDDGERARALAALQGQQPKDPSLGADAAARLMAKAAANLRRRE